MRRLAVAAILACAMLYQPAIPAAFAPSPAAAASPDTSGAPGGGGDPRSVGEGPGLVGNPLFAIAMVVGIGIVAAGLTALYVRATGGPRTRPPTGPPSRPRR